MYIHYLQFNGNFANRLFIGPFDDEARAEAFKKRLERTRQQSPHLSMEGVALEIAPGKGEWWSAIPPDQFTGFHFYNPETEQEVTIPLVD